MQAYEVLRANFHACGGRKNGVERIRRKRRGIPPALTKSDGGATYYPRYSSDDNTKAKV
jgi:hypothetical protein